MERDNAGPRKATALDRAESAPAREESARDRKESVRAREESAQERAEMNRRWIELAEKMGTLVEDVIAPGIRRMADEVFECGDEQVFFARATVRRVDSRSRRREFEALYVGDRAVLLNETKTTVRPAGVRAFAAFVANGQFGRYFPSYADRPVVPVVSSLSISDDMVTNLTRRGIYAVAMGDEAMQVLNFEAASSQRSRR